MRATCGAQLLAMRQDTGCRGGVGAINLLVMIDCLMLVMMLFVGIGLRKVSFSELGLWWWSRPQGMDLLVRV